MNHQWDDFSKSVAEKSLPRRESLRLLGAALAGAVLSPLGLGTAWGRGPDPCKAFCKCRNKTQQNACLATCRACSGGTSRLCGSCGNYACCGQGQACCGGHCANLGNDVYNCGGCGNVCGQSGSYEYGACVDGRCEYTCVEGAVDCGDGCTFLAWDPDNCGACGFVCNESTPYCSEGVCNDCAPGTALCSGRCIDIMWDGNNCGACGWQCQPLEYCSWGQCYGYYDYGYYDYGSYGYDGYYGY